MPWFVLLAIISMLLAVVFLATPFAVALIAGLLIYRWYRTNPGRQEQDTESEERRLEEHLGGLLGGSGTTSSVCQMLAVPRALRPVA